MEPGDEATLAYINGDEPINIMVLSPKWRVFYEVYTYDRQHVLSMPKLSGNKCIRRVFRVQ